MKKIPMSVKFCLPLILGLALFSGQALAQMGTSPQATIRQINSQAMASYANLQIPQALQLLQQAESLCRQYNLRGGDLARTYLNMGIVEAGGNQNNAAAMDYFKKAVCLDRSVMLDPLNSTPEVETLFNMARNQAQVPGTCAQFGIAPAYPQPQPQPTYPQPQPTYPQPQPQPVYPQPQPQPQAQLIRHQPVTQQLRLVPIPLYIDVNPSVTVGKVVLFYRTLGERIFQQVEMSGHGRGYAAKIGCDVLQTFDPSAIEYYIAVLDSSNQLLGTSGTEAQPYSVNMVQTLATMEPTLPNEVPPTKCVEECPPWNPNCNEGSCKQMGDLCDHSSECCSGMECQNEGCTPTEGGGGGERGPFDPIFRFNAVFGTGTGLVSGGDVTPYNQTSVNPNAEDGSGLAVATGFTWSKFHIRVNPMFYINEKLMIGINFRGGFVGSPDSEVMPFAPLVLASLAYRFVGEGSDMFELSALFGLGGGIIQHRVPYQDCEPAYVEEDDPWYDEDLDDSVQQIGCKQPREGDPIVIDRDNNWDWVGPVDDPDAKEKAYFRESGQFGMEVGLDSYIWFVNNFGLNIGVMIDVLVPDFALNIDFQLGLALRF
jgi:hypothetical protein